MKGNIARTTLVVFFIATLCMSIGSTAQAQGPPCSLARAAGSYANSMSGTFVGIGGTFGGSFTAVELLTADAEGNISGKQTANSNGKAAHATISGTATVNDDCTGTLSFSRFNESGNLVSTGTFDLVWDDNMREVRFVMTSLVLANGTPVPLVMKGEGRKVFPRGSNEE